MRESHDVQAPPEAMPTHISDNIDTIAEVRADFEKRTTRHQRAIEKATRAVGSPIALYALLAFVGAWTGYNSLAPRIGEPVFDASPFFLLQGVLGLCAVCIATMVLAAQNRQTHEAERRAHLEFQVNLLAEQKATKIICLLEELRRDLPIVGDRKDPVAEAMQQQIDPKAVLTALEGTLQPAPDAQEPTVQKRRRT